MGRKTLFSKSKQQIVTYFQSLDATVFSEKDLKQILDQEDWDLPQAWYEYNSPQFIETLRDQTELFNEVFLRFPKERYIRYVVKERENIYDLALSIPKTYFSHYTAMQYHGLTDQDPKTIYLSRAHSYSNYGNTITQENIDYALSKPQRKTNNYSESYRGYQFCLLYSKPSDKGIANYNGVRVTNIERTLIDAAVRPIYSGGVSEILEAYKRASEEISVNTIASMLRTLDYIYPYHQVIGFYLERTGNISEKQLRLLEAFPQEFDFYLTYDMKDSEYSERWKLYYPRGF